MTRTWWRRSRGAAAGGRAARGPRAGRRVPRLETLEQRALPTGGYFDTTFGGQGLVVTDFAGGNDFANAAVVEPDGKIVVAGPVSVTAGPSPPHVGVARYNPDGTLDTTFSGGTVTTSVLDTGNVVTGNALALALQPDGKILFACPTVNSVTLARLNANGTPDTTFGPTGTDGTTGVGGSPVFTIESPNSLAVQSDGGILVAGFVPALTHVPPHIQVWRLNANGILDTSFGIAGVVNSAGNTQADSVALQSDGKILAGGSFQGALGVARYLPNGTPDAGFGAGGQATVDFGTTATATVLVTQPDGKVLAAGSAGQSLALARLNPDGGADLGFGLGGKATTDFGPSRASATALRLENGGGFLVGGAWSPRPSPDAGNAFIAAEYFPDGSPNTRFGAGGTVVDNPLPQSVSRYTTFQADGKLVATGNTAFIGPPAGNDFLTARFVATSEILNGPPDRRYLQQVYLDLLGRMPDSAAAGWEPLLDGSPGARELVALGIESSLEYRTRLVQGLYRSLLGRDGDAAGVAGWVQFLSGGATAHDLLLGFLASAEYSQRNGGTAGLVGALYRDVLGRTPDDAGRAYWQSALGQGVSAAGVAFGIENSQEATERLVGGWYHGYLHRAPQPGETAPWTGQLQQGTPDFTVLAQFLASEEYFTRAQT